MEFLNWKDSYCAVSAISSVNEIDFKLMSFRNNNKQTKKKKKKIAQVPLKFSHDGKVYFAAVNNHVKITSVNSGQVIRTIDAHDATVTRLVRLEILKPTKKKKCDSPNLFTRPSISTRNSIVYI
jgi:hypothetical protein